MSSLQLQGQALVSWECQNEVFRQEVEGADDIRLNAPLVSKCMGDKKMFCNDVAPGTQLNIACSTADCMLSEVSTSIATMPYQTCPPFCLGHPPHTPLPPASGLSLCACCCKYILGTLLLICHSFWTSRCFDAAQHCNASDVTAKLCSMLNTTVCCCIAPQMYT